MNTRELIKDLISNSIFFLFIMTVVLSVLLIMGNHLMWEYLFFAVPFFGLYAARKFVFVLPTFFIIHGIFMAIPFFVLPSWEERLPMAAAAALFVLFSVRLRAKNEWRPGMGVAVQIIFCIAVLYLIMSVLLGVVVEGMDRFFFGMTFILIAAMLLVIHMENVDMRMAFLKNRLRDMSPARSVLAANNILIGGFLGFLMALGMLSLFSAHVWRAVQRGTSALLGGVSVFLGWLDALIMRRAVEEPVEEAVYDFPLGHELHFLYEDYEEIVYTAQEYNDYYDELVHEIISRVFYWHVAIMFILLAIVLFFAGRSVIRRLIRNFFNASNNDEEESLLPEDTKERLKFMLGDVASLFPRLLAGIKNPVRRAYIKKVNRHMRKGVKITRSDTHAAIAEKIRPREDISALTAQYEQVRYGR